MERSSRREVERVLAASGVPLTVFRAAMIIGSGSASFEILRYLVERLPVMVTPACGGIRPGVSPHAPHSCDDAVYAVAGELGLPITTHLAETLDEVRFVRDGSGPFTDLLRSVGAWTPDLRGWGRGPVERVQPLLQGRGAALVHLNYLDDAGLELLSRDAGSAHASVLVIGDAPTISVLDDMRFPWRRDVTDPIHLVAMATVHGARALGMDPGLVRWPLAGARNAHGMLAIHTGDIVSLTAAGSAQARATGALRGALVDERPCVWIWR